MTLLIIAATPAHAVFWSKKDTPTTPENWIPAAGDKLIVDVDTNIGYLIHNDDTRLEFPVATGQRKYVSYLGMHYFAGTPKQKWVVKEMSIQSDRYTFGEEGKFFRMYSNDKRTRYGIHTIANAEEIFEREKRYASMGCTLVTEEILNIIEKTFEVNGGELNVWSI